MLKLYSFNNLQSTSTTFRVEVCFDPTHPVFAGHFPGHPLVPGVFLVDILTSAVSAIIGKPVVLKESTNLKFVNMIDPGKHGSVMIEGAIELQKDENYKVDATIRQGELLFAKMKGMRFQKPDPKNT